MEDDGVVYLKNSDMILALFLFAKDKPDVK